jgi:serine/threonine protein phosphatase 1
MKTLIPNPEGRLIAVGDVHGCSGILSVVMHDVAPKPEDTFVFLGDLCNRGPDTRVFDVVIAIAKVCPVYKVLGNHEEMIVAAYQGGKDEYEYWCHFGGVQTLASFGAKNAREIPEEYLQFVAECADYHESEHYIFVHAGCDPNKPMDKQYETILRWNGFNPNWPRHMSGKTVVCGHSVQKQVFDSGHLSASTPDVVLGRAEDSPQLI